MRVLLRCGIIMPCKHSLTMHTLLKMATALYSNTQQNRGSKSAPVCADPAMLRVPSAWRAQLERVFAGEDVLCLAWAPSSAASTVVYLAAGIGCSLLCSAW